MVIWLVVCLWCQGAGGRLLPLGVPLGEEEGGGPKVQLVYPEGYGQQRTAVQDARTLLGDVSETLDQKLCGGQNSLCQKEDTAWIEEEDSGSAREVSSFTYYPVDTNVLSNIMGSVQDVINDLLGKEEDDTMVKAIEDKVASVFPKLDIDVGIKKEEEVGDIIMNITEKVEEVSDHMVENIAGLRDEIVFNDENELQLVDDLLNSEVDTNPRKANRRLENSSDVAIIFSLPPLPPLSPLTDTVSSSSTPMWDDLPILVEGEEQEEQEVFAKQEKENIDVTEEYLEEEFMKDLEAENDEGINHKKGPNVIKGMEIAENESYEHEDIEENCNEVEEQENQNEPVDNVVNTQDNELDDEQETKSESGPESGPEPKSETKLQPESMSEYDSEPEFESEYNPESPIVFEPEHEPKNVYNEWDEEDTGPESEPESEPKSKHESESEPEPDLESEPELEPEPEVEPGHEPDSGNEYESDFKSVPKQVPEPEDSDYTVLPTLDDLPLVIESVEKVFGLGNKADGRGEVFEKDSMDNEIEIMEGDNEHRKGKEGSDEEIQTIINSVEEKTNGKSSARPRQLAPITKVVETGEGKVQGVREETRAGQVYHKYLGIPYAAPPLASLRLQPPRPHEGWEGFPAGWTAVRCLQTSGDTVMGQEDCLVLNIWSPNATSLLPVLVWLSPSSSASSSSTDLLMERGVLLVTINSRQGALGFLSLGEDGLPGNLGLWDQRRALVWLGQNLAKFGGDPGRVTLLGQGDGAVEAHAHLLSPQAKGLFSQVILESGSLLRPTSLARTTTAATEASRVLLQRLGCGQHLGNSSQLLRCVQTLPAELIALRGNGTAWAPVLDSSYISKEPLVTMATSSFPTVPLLSGEGRQEAETRLAQLLQDLGSPGWEAVGASHLLAVPRGQETRQEVTLANTLARFYTGSGGVIVSSQSELRTMVEDAALVLPGLVTAELAAAAGSPVWRYREGGGRRPRQAQDIWDLGIGGEPGSTNVSLPLLSAWADFTVGGDPGPQGEQEVAWPQFQTGNSSVMVLGEQPQTEPAVSPEVLLLWRRLLWEPLVSQARGDATAGKTPPQEEPKPLVWLYWPRPLHHHHHYPYYTHYQGVEQSWVRQAAALSWPWSRGHYPHYTYQYLG